MSTESAGRPTSGPSGDRQYVLDDPAYALFRQPGMTPPTPVWPSQAWPSPVWRPPARRRPVLPIALAAGAVVVVTALLVYFLAIKPSTTIPKADFDEAVAAYNTAQVTLGTTVEDARALQASVPADGGADPAVLDALRTQIDAAAALIAPAPVMANKASDVRAQILQLKDDTQATNDATTNLEKAVADVVASARALAKGQLQSAISAAQAVLDGSEGLAPDDARTKLKAAIDAATAVLTTIDSADPAGLQDLVATQSTALAEASAALQAVSKVRCPSGVVLPIGVDQMVCGGMPPGAKTPHATPRGGGTVAMFSMPSKNIGCSAGFRSGGTICEAIKHTYKLPKEIVPKCTDKYCIDPCFPSISDGIVTVVRCSDPGPFWLSQDAVYGYPVPVLNYGSVANFDPVACLSASTGVVCWDVNTHHGFRMSASVFQHW